MLAQQPLLPVFSLNSLEESPNSLHLIQSLAAAGFTQLEITLRNPAAWQFLAQLVELTKSNQASLEIIAGSLSQLDQVEPLAKLGITKAVSPGWNKNLAKATQEAGINLLPGIATPSEAMQAAEMGYQQLKFFPANNLGTGYLASLAAALPELSFIPTGGINLQNLNDWLALPQVIAVGGSWLFASAAFKQQAWADFTLEAKTALKHAQALAKG